MAAKLPRPHSPYAAEAAALLGAEIRLGRRQRRWTQRELGERIGITSRTVYKIERGDLTVGLGAAFEAATLVGVPLFHPERSRLRSEIDRVDARASLLRRPSAQPSKPVRDDF